MMRSEGEELSVYLNRVKERVFEMCSEHPEIDVIAFPEYTWGREIVNPETIFQEVKSWNVSPILVLGSCAVKYMNQNYNGIFVVDRDNYWLISKRHPVKHEKEVGGIKSANKDNKRFVDNVIEIRGVKFGFVACSDMWQANLIREIATKGAEILICTSMTVTEPPLQLYARTQWHCMIVTRSREFVLPIVVIDSPYQTEEKITGRVTCGADPSRKHPSLRTLSDFLVVPDSDRNFFVTFELERVREYRKYRQEQGLLKLN